LRRRQPVAVYRVIDEAELFGESSDASNPGARSPLQGFDVESQARRHEFRPVRRSLRIAGAHRGLIAALLSVSAVAIAGAWTIRPSVTGRRQPQVQRTSPPIAHAQRRPMRHTHARPLAPVEGRERHRRRGGETARTRASANAGRRGSVHVAVSALAAASSHRSGGQSVQQAAKEFGFER
jgi:hypothetical protein